MQPYTTYTISFDAKASGWRQIGVSMLQNVAPYTAYGLNQTLNLTTSWQAFAYTFITNGFGSPVSDARLDFLLGFSAQPGDTFWFDNVSIVPTSYVLSGQ